MKRLLYILTALASFGLYASGQITVNNTPACVVANAAGCNGPGQMPFSTDPGNIGAQTVVVDPLPTNVSTLSVKNYMYSGFSGQVWVAGQTWFCNSSTPCNGHLNIGMDMSNAAQALAQLQWWKTVGADALIDDYYGCADQCPVPQSAAQHFNWQVASLHASTAQANPTTAVKWGLMLDQGAINGSGTGQCAPASGDQSACLINAINLQMDYAAKNWFFQSSYVVNPKTGRPVMMFFIDHTQWPDTNFNTVFAAVAAHATSGQSCGTSCTYAKNIDLVDENNGAFSETGIMGGYSWLSPIAYSIANQFCYLGNCPTGNYYSSFYATARANPTKMAIGTIKKGFDDGRSFGSNRVTAQRCGTVPSLMAAAVSTAGYGVSSQIDVMMLETANDYEEGSELETGIDNCITIGQPTIAGGTISWPVIKSDLTYASLTTISKFQIWTGTSSPTTLVTDGISSSATSAAAPTLTAGQSAWIVMVGQPLIQTRISPPATVGTCPAKIPAGITGCYYISAAGSDANDGTAETTVGTHGPWLHSPGMPGATGGPAVTVPAPGQGFIFRGGDTWHFGNAGLTPYVGACSGNHCLNWQWGGSALNSIYIGVDQTWFAGGSWVRPIFNGDNPVTNARPATCAAKDFQAVNAFLIGTHDYVQFDDFEFTGFCNGGTSGVSAGMLNQSGAHATATNNYFHGYTMPTGATDDEYYAIQGGNGTGFKNAPGSQCLNNVFDNSDGTNGNVGVWPNGKATMGAIQNACSVVAYSVFNRVSNGIVSSSTSVHDNSFIDLYDPSLSGNTNHGNIWNSNNDPLTNVGTQQFYNNVFRNINEGVSVWLMPTPTAYIYNNVEWNNFNSANCYVIGGSSQVTGLPLTTVYFYNNTSDAPCTLRGLNNGSDPVWKGTVNFANNHYVGYSPALLSSTYSADAGTLPIWTDLGNELFQSEAAANAQGYVPSNFYAPTSTASSTAAAGQNASVLCVAAPALCSGTSQGAVEAAASGGQVANYPGIAVNVRAPASPPNWDIGPYQFVSTTPPTVPYTLNAVQPPTTPSNTNYAAWQATLATGLQQNLFTGGTVIYADGCSSGCGQLTYIDQGTTFPILSWTAVDAVVATYTAVGKKANNIHAPAIEGSTNNGTPLYVYTQNWADFLDVDGSGNRNPILTYAVGTKYRVAQYVYANSHYWQMTGTVADPSNPTYGIGCTSAVQPAFVHGSGPYTESGAWPCTWTESTNTSGTHAPLEDVICTTNFKGTNCWELTITNIVGDGTTVTLTVAKPPTYPAGQSLLISGITNAGYTALNGTWTMTGSNATTVTFLNATVFASCNAACLAPAGTVTVSGSHLLNITTTNATNAMVASALPVAYEMPFSIYRNYFCDQAIKHYAAGQLNGGYIVCGFQGGGEYSSFDIAQQPFYGSASQFRSIWLSAIDDFQAEQDATRVMFNPNLTIYGDMNAVGQDFAYTDQEAKLAASHNIGLRTNGLSVDDITNIVCSQGVSSSYCTAIATPTPCDNPPVSPTLGCTNGGWYHAMYSYPTMKNGLPSFGSLQTLTGSTPSNCHVGASFPVTGPLSPLAASSDCPQGFIGLLNALVSLRTTGLVNFNSGPVENWSNTELYTSGPANCGTNCTHFNNSAYPVGDLLFGLDYGYSSTTFAQATASVLAQVVPYDASFALFLNANSTIGGCPGSGGTQCATAGFSLNGGLVGGPPNYLGSRTDIAVAPPGGFIAVPPQVGPNVCTVGNLLACGNVLGVNAIVTDPDFSTQISRMTDANSVLNANTVQTADSGGANISNCTGTVTCGGTGPTYVILKSTGGNRWLFQFNPATMITSPAGALIGNFVASWAHTHPYRAYYMNGTILTQMDVTPGTQTFSTTPIYDFGGTQCLGNSVNGQNPYSLVWTGVLQPSFDDNVFGLGFGNQPGGQDHGYHFASYNIATGHCTVVNTSTGVITDNGSSIGSVSFPERFLLHEGHSEPNPTYAVLIPTSGAGCLSGVCAVGPYLYTVGTTTAISCAPSSACSGETASGSLSLMQGNGTGNLNVHNYASWQTTHPLITNSALIPTGLASCAGNVNHPSWNNNDGTDTLPIFTSYSGTCTTFNAAWQKEIIGYSQDGSKVWRFGHNFSSGINSQFDTSNALGQVSQDGRFMFVSSDWLGTLGPAQTTTPGPCVLATTCRGDVFAFRLN